MSLNDVVQKVNPKMVKIYGSGRFKGLPAYMAQAFWSALMAMFSPSQTI